MPDELESGHVDPFASTRIYPEAEAIFKTQLEPPTQIRDDCLVVLDANALLVPYTIGPKTLTEIENTYRSLVAANRLIIPGQVAREFANNRAKKLAELFQQLSRKRNSIRTLQGGRYPLLDGLDVYSEAVELERKIDQHIKTYRDTLGKLLDHIRGWTWNDPVSLVYSQLFGDTVVFDPEFDESHIRADLKWRKESKVPPGYKDVTDSDEPDHGIGDLLIWHTILKVGQEHEKHLIFVSGDEKPDWYHRSEGQALYPRYELVDEYRRQSQGKSFYIVPFSRFLTIFGASESVVEEVRAKEQQDTPIRVIPGTISIASLAQSAEEAVYRWLLGRHDVTIVERTVHLKAKGSDALFTFDFLVRDDELRSHAYDVRYVGGKSPAHTRYRINEFRLRAHDVLAERVVESFTAVFVASDLETAERVIQSLRRVTSLHRDTGFVVGVVDPQGDFEVLYESF